MTEIYLIHHTICDSGTDNIEAIHAPNASNATKVNIPTVADAIVERARKSPRHKKLMLVKTNNPTIGAT